jgi:hypothetical protein
VKALERARLARPLKHDERECRAAERQRLPDEPRRAQPQQSEGQHDGATLTWGASGGEDEARR